MILATYLMKNHVLMSVPSAIMVACATNIPDSAFVHQASMDQIVKLPVLKLATLILTHPNGEQIANTPVTPQAWLHKMFFLFTVFGMYIIVCICFKMPTKGAQFSGFACRGKLFCLPHPLGCICGPGFFGIDSVLKLNCWLMYNTNV